MGFVSGLFNGSKGANWEAGNVNIDRPATITQANTAYNQTQQGLDQQQAFLQALQGQNGIQNQSNVFNQLQGVANGTGPNPAQAMLNNATRQNIANQAALMAGQRGASANAGLIARQAAQQGANLQQNAAGQAASLQANQGLNALNQLGGISGQQVANQANAVQGYNQAAQNNQSNILNSINQQNNAAVGMQSNVNNTNSQLANTNAQAQNKMVGGILNGASSFLGLAHGGEVKVNGPRSRVAIHLNGGGQVPAMLSPGEKYLSPEQALAVADGKENIKEVGKIVPGKAKVKGDSEKNDIIPAKLEEGGMVIPRSIMESEDPVKHAIAFVRAHQRGLKK